MAKPKKLALGVLALGVGSYLYNVPFHFSSKKIESKDALDAATVKMEDASKDGVHKSKEIQVKTSSSIEESGKDLVKKDKEDED